MNAGPHAIHATVTTGSSKMETLDLGHCDSRPLPWSPPLQSIRPNERGWICLAAHAYVDGDPAHSSESTNARKALAVAEDVVEEFARSLG